MKGIFSAHGSCIEEIYANSELKELINSNMIERIIFLDNKQKGKVSEVYLLDRKNNVLKLSE